MLTFIHSYLQTRVGMREDAVLDQLSPEIRAAHLDKAYTGGRKIAADITSRNGRDDAKRIVMRAFERVSRGYPTHMDAMIYKGMADFINSNGE
jgi:hypothetical protein